LEAAPRGLGQQQATALGVEVFEPRIGRRFEGFGQQLVVLGAIDRAVGESPGAGVRVAAQDFQPPGRVGRRRGQGLRKRDALGRDRSARISMTSANSS
jgi:hypothetical protein